MRFWFDMRPELVRKNPNHFWLGFGDVRSPIQILGGLHSNRNSRHLDASRQTHRNLSILFQCWLLRGDGGIAQAGFLLRRT